MIMLSNRTDEGLEAINRHVSEPVTVDVQFSEGNIDI